MNARVSVLTLALGTGLACLSGCGSDLPTDPAPNKRSYEMLRAHIDQDNAGDVGTTVVVADPTGWATLKGRFVLTGPPPAQTPIVVDKDTSVCAPGGKTVLSQTVVVDGNGGLSNVLIFVSSKVPNDPKWIHADYEAVRNAEVEFDQKECVFLSRVFGMWDTQTLKILNSDPVGHNTKFGPYNIIVDSNSSIKPGIVEATRAPESVSCTIHPWMSAYLFSHNNPLFAVTKADGTFEIPNVPAGVDLEFRVWHETAGYLGAVTVNGQSEEWSKGKFTQSFTNEQTHEMQVAIAAEAF